MVAGLGGAMKVLPDGSQTTTRRLRSWCLDGRLYHQRLFMKGVLAQLPLFQAIFLPAWQCCLVFAVVPLMGR